MGKGNKNLSGEEKEKEEKVGSRIRRRLSANLKEVCAQTYPIALQKCIKICHIFVIRKQKCPHRDHVDKMEDQNYFSFLIT